MTSLIFAILQSVMLSLKQLAAFGQMAQTLKLSNPSMRNKTAILPILRKLTLAVIALSFANICFAAPSPLSYQRWKSQQVIEAKNQVARISNEIQMLKIGTKKPTKGDLPSELAMLEGRLNSAKENEKFADGLAMEHYVAVHLSQFKGDPVALKEAAQSMKPDELGQLLKVLLQTGNSEGSSITTPAIGGSLPAPTAVSR